jgi:hypothetical protein
MIEVTPFQDQNRTDHQEKAEWWSLSRSRGHDASYLFKTIGAAEGAVITGERGAGYYCRRRRKATSPPGPRSAAVSPPSASTTAT